MQIIQLLCRGGDRVLDTVAVTTTEQDRAAEWERIKELNRVAEESDRIRELNKVTEPEIYEVDDLDLSIHNSDTMFIVTRNNNIHKNNISNLVSKLFVIRETKTICLKDMSKLLSVLNTDKLDIFSIDNSIDSNNTSITRVNNGSQITYVSLNHEAFKKFLNNANEFLIHNKNALYILRDGGFFDIKNLFSSIGNNPVCLGKGTSQKHHALSPLDFRLSIYLMAMFNCNYKLISYLNTFYDMDKDKYLSYYNKPYIVTPHPVPVKYVNSSSKIVKYVKVN